MGPRGQPQAKCRDWKTGTQPCPTTLGTLPVQASCTHPITRSFPQPTAATGPPKGAPPFKGSGGWGEPQPPLAPHPPGPAHQAVRTGPAGEGGPPVCGGAEGSPPGKTAAKEPCQPRLIIPVISANSFPGQPRQGRFQEQLTVIILNPPNSPPPASPQPLEETRQGCVRPPGGSARPAGALRPRPAMGGKGGREECSRKAGLAPPGQPHPPPTLGYHPPKAVPAPRPPALSASQRSSTPSQASDDGKEAEAWPHPGDRNPRLGNRSRAEWSRALGRWPPGLTERWVSASRHPGMALATGWRASRRWAPGDPSFPPWTRGKQRPSTGPRPRQGAGRAEGCDGTRCNRGSSRGMCKGQLGTRSGAKSAGLPAVGVWTAQPS